VVRLGMDAGANAVAVPATRVIIAAIFILIL